MNTARMWALILAIGAPLAAQESLGTGLTFREGPVNSAVFTRHGKSLAIYADDVRGGLSAEAILLTHVRRDVVAGLWRRSQAGARITAPEKEAELLSRPERFWNDWRDKRFHDYAQQSSKMPDRAVRVDRTVKGGDTLAWEGLAIKVLDTPGYTRGAVSYVVDCDGRKIVFTGDLMRDDGKLQDLFSLQDAIPAAKIGGYHGWAGRLGDLVASLAKVAAEKPDMLVPARGPVVRQPQAAIDRLLGRIRAAYANYLSIDALRWYFKDEHILTKARRVLGAEAQVDWMPMSETKPLPEHIRAISNSRLILSANGRGFLVDCGGAGIVGKLREMRAAGTLAAVDHVFITHYHDDHTDSLPALVREFGPTVHACGSLVDVLEHPGDYRLPCLTRNPISVTGRHEDRESFRWEEYRVTIFDFPGQTLHHNGLLVERDGCEPVFFAGDSFTPTGIDDYCLQNRNFLAKGRGFSRCLDLVSALPAGCWLVNQHVQPAFRFTSAQIDRMRATLQARRPLLAALLPYDDPNFGLDEGWAVLHPYAVRVRPGEETRLQLRIMNHSPQAREFRATVEDRGDMIIAVAESMRVPPHAQGALDVRVKVPTEAAAGWRVLTVGVAWEGNDLRAWAEALLDVAP